MADISDVTAALAAGISDIVYPNGTAQPPAQGVACQVSEGWPLANTLELICAKPNATAASPVSLVSIYPVPGTTGDGGTVMDFRPGTVAELTLGISVSLDADEIVATFAGLAVGGEVATIIVNGSSVFSYSCQPNDTAEVVAFALAVQANVALPQAAWLPGTGSISIPGTRSLTARVGTTVTFGRKVSRQKTQIRVVVWSSNPADRTAVAKAIDAAIKAKMIFPLPDTTNAIVTYQGTNLDDGQERAGLYRRDLVYIALFDTIEEFEGVEVTSVGLEIAPPSTAPSSPSA